MKKRIPVPIHKLPPVIRNAVTYITQELPMPDEIALAAVLASQATVNQGLYWIRDTRGGLQPLSLHIKCISESGEGKSPASDMASRPIKEFEAEFKQPRETSQARFAQDEIQDQSIRWLAKEMGRMEAKGKDISHLKRKIEDLLDVCQQGEYLPRFLFNDSSSSKLMEHMANVFPFVTQFADEGVINYKSGAFENLGFQIKMWDNGKYQYDRANRSFEIDGALSTFTAPQPKIFWKWMASSAGQQAIETGKLGRGLFTFPESIQGTRDFSGSLSDFALIQPYYDVLRRNLDRYRDGLPVREVLELSPEARAYARWYQQAIEKQLRKGGFFCEMRASANKSALNVLRLAGNIHVAEGYEGQVTGETMRCSILLAAFFLWEYLCGVAPETELERHARLLEEFLRKQDDGARPFHVTRRDILRGADPAIRHVETLDAAAAYLQKLNVVVVTCGPRGSWSISFKENFQFVPTPIRPSTIGDWRPPIGVGREWYFPRENAPEEPQFRDDMIWPGVSMPEF